MSLCSFEGASGRTYDYSVLDFKSRAAFPIGGGNYVFTRAANGVLEVVCAGETDSMWSIIASSLWDKAKKHYGATTPFIHANPDQRARQQESLDIVRKYQPPMNVDAGAGKTGS
jgi:hypothetical protein